MGIIGAVCALSACCGGNEQKEQSNIPAAFVKDLVAEMLAETDPAAQAATPTAALLERGYRKDIRKELSGCIIW